MDNSSSVPPFQRNGSVALMKPRQAAVAVPQTAETKSSDEKKRVYIIYTGGTAGMKLRADGTLGPEAGYLTEQIHLLPELQSQTHRLELEVHEWETVLDSSDFEMSDWKKLADDIHDHYLDFDGFVIIHGTDTMAYTACSLAFMLENLGKPVIITGSQIPFHNVFNDARRNLIVSIMYAANYDIPEVCIFFNNVLLRGCRATKVDTEGLTAFASPNLPPLGTLATELQLVQEALLAQPKKRMRVFTDFSPDVAVFSLTPGFSDSVLSNVLKAPLKGLVLKLFGNGNCSTRRESLMQVIKEAIDRGVVVVVISQCMRGMVNFNRYVNGSRLRDIGVVSGSDLTTECAAVKLAYLLGKGLPVAEVKALMATPLRGEMTLLNDNK